MQKSKKPKPKFDALTSDEIAVLKTVNAGVPFEAIDVKDAKSKACISSQNEDTGLPSYNPSDTRPYEQKNTTSGFHRNGMGSK